MEMIKWMSITGIYLFSLVALMDYAFFKGVQEGQKETDAQSIYRQNAEYVCKNPEIKKLIDKK
jgi:hypothetical protein